MKPVVVPANRISRDLTICIEMDVYHSGRKELAKMTANSSSCAFEAVRKVGEAINFRTLKANACRCVQSARTSYAI